MYWTGLPTTERHGRALNTTASYSGGRGFKYRPNRQAILTAVFHGFTQSLKVSVEKVPSIRPRPLPSTSYPIHHSPINLSFDTIQFELLRKR
jgi:hypothetical protein